LNRLPLVCAGFLYYCATQEMGVDRCQKDESRGLSHTPQLRSRRHVALQARRRAHPEHPGPWAMFRSVPVRRHFRREPLRVADPRGCQASSAGSGGGPSADERTR